VKYVERKPDITIDRRILFRQIGAKIMYQRTISGVSQSVLAKAVHVSQSTMGRIENGRYNLGVSVSVLADIANALGIDLAVLFTFTDAEKRAQMCDDKPVLPVRKAACGRPCRSFVSSVVRVVP